MRLITALILALSLAACGGPVCDIVHLESVPSSCSMRVDCGGEVHGINVFVGIESEYKCTSGKTWYEAGDNPCMVDWPSALEDRIYRRCGAQ